MFYYPEQYSTYFYTNVLPMWQSINNGNWKSVEFIVRRVAHAEGDLDVWTGGLGILKLSGKSIYLSKDSKNSSKFIIPVPKLLYKIVYNEKTNEALVFITANNPYIAGEAVPRDYRICKEYQVCSDKFEQFNKKNEGYTYCCLYRDFITHPDVQDIFVHLKKAKPLKLF